jgi:hypothetical protein
MARARSLILSMEVTTAARSHNCRHSDNHRIPMGARRLTITSDGDKHHYCLGCAQNFLTRDMERLKALLDQVVGVSSGLA